MLQINYIETELNWLSYPSFDCTVINFYKFQKRYSKIQSAIMGNVDKFRATADLLERCCVSVEAMRRREEEDTVWRQDQALLRTDLERRLMESKCLEENKLQMTEALLVTRLQVSRNQLEQAAGATSNKGQDVEEEVRTLQIYRKDLIQELCDIDMDISKKTAEIEEKTKTNQSSKEEQADDEVLAGMKALVVHNLNKLHSEQKMLTDILEATKTYASSLPHCKSICENQLAEAKKLCEELEYNALIRKARALTTTSRKKIEHVKDETMHVECANDDDNNDRLEVVLAEKAMVLESFQTMLTNTVEVSRKLAVFRENNILKTKKDIKSVIDSVIEEVFTKTFC